MTQRGHKVKQLDLVFARLKDILKAHANRFRNTDRARYFGLEATIGPATLEAWKGKKRSALIPIAWVEFGKSHVSYHLMGVSGNAKLLDACSSKLRARMQGKACFHFTAIDEALFVELEALTANAIESMKRGGYIE
jgi:hypothetical protein